jgi:hypothetical protein
LAAPGQTLEIWDGGPVAFPYHQIWARRGPGTPSSADAFAADPTMLDFLLEQERDDRWAYRRRPEVTLALDGFGAVSPTGVPFVRPQVALLYKAKSTRYKDERDFDAVLPHLGDSERAWLGAALDEVHAGHPWRARL